MLAHEKREAIMQNVMAAVLNGIENAKASYEGNHPYLNKKEAAEYLGIAHNTLSSWVKFYGLPEIRIFNTIRYDRRELDKWMRSHPDLN